MHSMRKLQHAVKQVNDDRTRLFSLILLTAERLFRCILNENCCLSRLMGHEILKFCDQCCWVLSQERLLLHNLPSQS